MIGCCGWREWSVHKLEPIARLNIRRPNMVKRDLRTQNKAENGCWQGCEGMVLYWVICWLLRRIQPGLPRPELRITTTMPAINDGFEIIVVFIIDLSFQNWHEKFDKFWPEHSKVSKIFTLIGSFWAKYILFELKKYRGVIFHDMEEWYKIWRKTDLLLLFWPTILQILSDDVITQGKNWATFWQIMRKISLDT